MSHYVLQYSLEQETQNGNIIKRLMEFQYQLNLSMLRGLFGLLIFTGNDRVLEGQAAYRLGQAYDKIGEGETALEVYSFYLCILI